MRTGGSRDGSGAVQRGTSAKGRRHGAARDDGGTCGAGGMVMRRGMHGARTAHSQSHPLDV